MSNPIKKNINVNGTVKIGDGSQVNFAEMNTPKKGRNDLSLNFSNTIDREMNIWRHKLDKKIASFDESMDQKIQEAYNKGLADGVKKEQSERERYISEHFSKQFGIINILLNDTKQKNTDAFRGLEKKLINLSVAIAEKLIHVNINNEPELIENIVSEAMSGIITGETVILKVSPHDFTIINTEYEKWHATTDNVKSFKIESDKRLGIGDCLIETESGMVDATLKNRLEIIAEALLKINH
jgi:flagellar assembly protein FliH